MITQLNRPIFTEESINNLDQYIGKYVRYKQHTYIVASIQADDTVILKKADLVSNWYARVEDSHPIRISSEQLRKESTLILKLDLDKADF